MEAQLQAPAGLDFGDRRRVSVQEVLEQLHERHHLSIRFDMPTFAAMRDIAIRGDGWVRSPTTLKRGQTLPAAFRLKDDLQYFPAGPEFKLSRQVQALDEYRLRAGVGDVLADADLSSTDDDSIPAADATAPSEDSATPSESVAESKPESSAQPDEVRISKPETTDGEEPAMGTLQKAELHVHMVDLKNGSVAAILRHALDALPADTGSKLGGLPVPLTNAMLWDYVVEEDGLLITTRMNALLHKETRVYSVKHLPDLTSEQLAGTIRHAVRPWSWRSQIGDLGEQLKQTPVLAESIGSIVKTGVQIFGGEIGMAVTTADGESPAIAESDEFKASGSVGNALINGLVTLLQVTLTSAEILHYAEPPTASIEALPGKLIIMQSQPAHREIDDLLKQLAEE
ncbi:MAG TPA: hypothetical protein VKU82_16505 [Planctomycetaceae bacterium]|nr:hypothetical protein [Planctomycetaceae bacterium]